MNNLIRFLVGLIALLFLLIIGVGLLVLFSPLILTGIFLFIAITIIVVVFFSILYVLGAIWHVTRKQPALGKSKQYSMKQGRDR